MYSSSAKQLTPRHREIVACILAGDTSNRQIATRLGIAEGTVRAHLKTIFKRLGVSTRLELAVRMLKQQHRGEEAA